MTLAPLFALLWIAWAVSWFGFAWWSDATEKRVGLHREIGHGAALTIGAVLCAIPAPRYQGALRLWHLHRPEAWSCVGLAMVGFAFCWWGRIHLGRLWSAQITRKADHRVVDTGPYRLVRHPIYSGLLLSVLATAVARGTLLGVGGCALIALGLWMKARLEEEWLGSELGANAYDAYKRRVPMLVPFGPRTP